MTNTYDTAHGIKIESRFNNPDEIRTMEDALAQMSRSDEYLTGCIASVFYNDKNDSYSIVLRDSVPQSAREFFAQQAATNFGACLKTHGEIHVAAHEDDDDMLCIIDAKRE